MLWMMRGLGLAHFVWGIRGRIDHEKCLGHQSDVAWHMAPWVRGYLLLKNGRVLPIEILLSGTVVGDLLFAEKTAPNSARDGASPRR